MYYYCKTKLISCVVVASPILFSTMGFGQTTSGIDSLNQVRSQLIATHQSTSDIDLLLHQSGNNPTCIIQQLDQFTFTFTPYLPLGDEQREQKVNLRLKSHYAYLNVIDFSDDFISVRIHCNQPLTPAIINELTSHFGYNGYEETH